MTAEDTEGDGVDDGTNEDHENHGDDGTDRDHETDEDRNGQSDTGGDDYGHRERDLRLQDVDRVFSILEEAVTSDAFDGRQFDRLLSVLERAVAGSSETDPETLAEFVSLLEELVVEPDDVDGDSLEQTLSILEEALAEATGQQWEESDDVFAVLSEAIRDPTRVDPDDVERFRSGLESAVVEMTGSSGLGQLFSFPELAAGESDGGLDDREPENGEPDDELFRIARLAAGMTQRATGYSLESGVRSGTRMAYAAANAGSPAELVTETRAITLDELRRAGVDVGTEQEDWLERHEDELVDERPVTVERLQERGERLLSQSAELGREESLHPAFDSILDELAPDEARILRLLATKGPQPTLDVYDKRYVPFRSTLVAANLSRIGSDAGCRTEPRTQLYLTNLERLGLIEFRDDPIEDLKRYQVLEAQPHIEAAQAEARRPKTTYGAVQLTDLGIEFCETCLSLSVGSHRSSARFWDEE